VIIVMDLGSISNKCCNEKVGTSGYYVICCACGGKGAQRA